ncbi:MAG: Lacal_2735 family protein [Saprospiraceae bacterium]|nr:Lacal_2735 family protein [Saprospiraceae bacterium]
MFNLFKKKSEREKLQERYEKLIQEGYNLSNSNRKDSYLKYAEAQEILQQIEELAAGVKK